MSKLSDVKVKKAKATDAAYRLSDGHNMYLLIHPNGGKYWRMDYRFDEKRKTLALGAYPEISLAEARQSRDAARKLLAHGVDPGDQKKAQKTATVASSPNSFEIIAREWFIGHAPSWKLNHSSKIIARLENDIFPWTGTSSIGEITAPALLAIVRRIEGRGALETAHRALANCGQVFRYAVATGRAERDPTGDLRGALPPVNKKNHFAAITDPVQMGQLLRDIEGYAGSFIVRCAFRLSPLLFVRPGELRRMEWTEVNLDAALWTIPAEKMKMGVTHLVPLATQAVTILREIQPLTGTGKYVFPGDRDADRPMCDNAVRSALRRMGWTNDMMTPHGFRAMASTCLDRMRFPSEIIELQLAHKDTNAIRAAYKREAWAMHMPERIHMMQQWADYLDKLRNDDDSRERAA